MSRKVQLKANPMQLQMEAKKKREEEEAAKKAQTDALAARAAAFGAIKGAVKEIDTSSVKSTASGDDSSTPKSGKRLDAQLRNLAKAGNMRRSEVVAAMKGRGGRGGGGARIRMQETDVDPSIERRRQEEKDEEDKRARVQAAVRAAMQAQGISVASTPVESDSNSRDGNGSVGDSNSPGDDPDRSEDGDDNDVSEGMSVPLLASVPAPRLSIPSKPPGAPSSRLVSDKPDVSPVISSRLPEASLPRAIPIPLASPVTSSSAGFAPTGPPVARPPPRAIPIRPPPRPQVIPQTPVVTPEIVEPVMQRRPSNGSATKSPAHDAFATRRASGSQDFNHHQPHPPEDAHAARRPSFSLVDTGTVDVLKSRRQSITIPHAALLSPTAPTAPIPPILSQQPRHHKSSNSISESDTVTSMSSTSTRGTEKSSCNCAHCSAPGLHLPVPYSLLREQVRCNEFTLRRCTAIETRLSPEEFIRVFEVNMDTFRKLPHWQQVQLRKKTKLFLASPAV